MQEENIRTSVVLACILINRYIHVLMYISIHMYFYDGETTLVDKERATDTVCLDFCKVFDMMLPNLLLSKLERY